jgi:tetratricopeptide (TPR) repeat protein
MRGRLTFLVIIQAARLFAFQPDNAALRKLFEDALSRRIHEFGEADPRTAQAARDLGQFLQRSGDVASARRAMANAVRIDEKALGPKAPETLEDVWMLASISSPGQAEPLLVRAAESPDPTVAGPALTSLAEMHGAAGDRAGAARLLRRAVEKADAVERDSLTVALTLSVLADLVPPKDAIPLLKRAVAIDEEKLGPQDPQTVQTARQLDKMLRATGQPAH